jgi:Ca2+-binding RTX toxin-like protein
LLGAYPGVDFHTFIGLIDEASVYNRALSAADVQSLFTSGMPAGPSDGVTVNLQLSTSSGLSSGISGIQNVIGSAGNDILVGNGGNVLKGGAGRDLIIAGALGSIIDGGEDEDILIGGTTDYDTDAAALIAVMAEWSRQDRINDDYLTRVANLMNGTNGAPIMNATTVTSNGLRNDLKGNSGLDFYFANVDMDALDRDPLTEALVAV